MEKDIDEIIRKWPLSSAKERSKKKSEVLDWLDNFQPSEKQDMLLVLQQLEVLSWNEVRDYVESLAKELKKLFQHDLSGVRFFPLGDYTSSSGTNFLYNFRQELEISNSCFPLKHFTEIDLSSVAAMVFVDDIIGSGNQATRFAKESLSEIQKEIDTYYVSLFAFENGLKKVIKEAGFTKVFSARTLSDEFKAFSPKTKYFTDPNQRSRLKNICKKYGEKLYPKHPLGYDDSQCLFILPHTVPNNTPPIIWAGPESESKPGEVWKPIWKRKKATLPRKEKKPDLKYLIGKYFTFLRENFAQMSFKGLSAEKLISFPLEEIYTDLSMTEELPEDRLKYLRERERVGKIEFMEQERNRVQINPADVINAQYSVITGDPGAGKSTLLRYIALAFIDEKAEDRLEVSENYFPILFPIAAYAEASKNTPAYSMKTFLEEYFRGKELPDLTPLFERAMKEDRALFLLDGLDEVTDETERKRMVESIRNFIINNDYSGNRYVVTCRIASYTKSSRFEGIKGKEFTHFTILPFQRETIRKFLYQWYCCYERDINGKVETYETEAEKNLDKMMGVLDRDKNILALATNPLMLTILALVEHEGGELPKNRADLYEKCLRMLAGAWNKIRSEIKKPEFKLGDRRITDDFIIEFLGPVAYEMHEKAQPDIEYDELKTKLAEKFYTRNKDMTLSKEQADDFIRIMKEWSGILQEISPKVYGFMHLTFKEYLAARVLTDLSEDRLGDLGERLFQPEWKEVVLLTFSILKKRYANDFVKGIYEKKKTGMENLILASECIVDSGRDKVKVEFYDKLVDEMQKVMEGDLPPGVRASVGESLGWVGDPRDLKEFIPIPDGEYKVSLGKVTLKSFALGRYPVTNRWFEEFIRSGGYTNKDFWSDEGRRWLEYEKANQPEYWNDRKWRCPNAPVVGVAWYEAYAFTQWLTVKNDDGYKYRLPDENEWEAAASGFKQRKYSWGNDWDVNKCNSNEIKLGRISPVGIFQRSDTPEPECVSDLSGNVCEWTSSHY